MQSAYPQSLHFPPTAIEFDGRRVEPSCWDLWVVFMLLEAADGVEISRLAVALLLDAHGAGRFGLLSVGVKLRACIVSALMSPYVCRDVPPFSRWLLQKTWQQLARYKCVTRRSLGLMPSEKPRTVS
jgi:hypothetical protein